MVVSPLFEKGYVRVLFLLSGGLSSPEFISLYHMWFNSKKILNQSAVREWVGFADRGLETLCEGAVAEIKNGKALVLIWIHRAVHFELDLIWKPQVPYRSPLEFRQ